MAAIGTLRNKMGTIIVIIIALAIIGFLLMDVTNSQTGMMTAGGRKDALGSVNGEKIGINEFNNKFEEAIKNYQDRSQQPVTDDLRNNIRNQTWDQLVNDLLFSNVYKKLGLAVTPDELADLMTGKNPHPYVVQSFTNPQTGQFDAAQVRMFVQNVDRDEEGQEPGTKRRMWNNFQTEIEKDQARQKYQALLTKGIYSPTWMNEMAYVNSNRYIDFRYILLPYAEISDEQVKPTDDELKAYLKEHSAKFTGEEELRKIQYISYPIVASATDTAATMKYLTEKLEDFRAGEKYQDDSLFVKLYSEDAFDDAYYAKSNLPSPYTDSIFSMKDGGIFGPYVDGGKIKFAKVCGRKMVSDSVRVREIFFSFAGIKSQEEGRKKVAFADSIYTLIDSLKADFGMMAAMHSEDPVSKLKGGDIGWVKKDEKDKYYNNLIFYRAQVGKAYKVYDNQGIRFVQVVEEKPSAMGLRVAFFTKSIVPSGETERNIYSEATRFAADNQSEEKFKEAAKSMAVRTADFIKKNDYQIMGLPSARAVVRWAYTAKQGEVSPVISAGDQYVVAYLEQARDKGVPDFTAVKDQLTREVAMQKRFELLKKKVTDAKASSLDELASKLGVTVTPVERMTVDNGSLPSGGYEPAAVAAALGTAPGKMSPPVKGRGNLIVVETTNIQQPPKANDLSIYASQTGQRAQQMVNRAMTEGQKKAAKIEDNRFEMFQ